MNKLLPNSRTEAMRAILERDPSTGDFKPCDNPYNGNDTYWSKNTTILREHKRRQNIADLLMKYTDPKPEYDGITAWELSGKIMEIMK